MVRLSVHISLGVVLSCSLIVVLVAAAVVEVAASERLNVGVADGEDVLLVLQHDYPHGGLHVFFLVHIASMDLFFFVYGLFGLLGLVLSVL